VINQLEKESASVILPLEFYDGASIIFRKTTVIINPYKGNLEFHYPDSVENRYFLGVSIPSHKEGECRILNKVYKLYLSNQSGPAGKESNGNIPFEPGDIITVEGLQYQFSSVSVSGDTLHLKYIGHTSRPEGFTENFYVPEVKARTIDLEEFKLSQLKGKYVLLDFWGTWCDPCIKLIPSLKGLHDKFKGEEFVMVSVANDNNIEKVKTFVRDHGMDWINVYQNERGDPADADFLKKMKISVYPITILIDPDGKIISRGKGIEDIEKVLNEKLR
jgi:thiol-disulfide isomerase/thioredoxin